MVTGRKKAGNHPALLVIDVQQGLFRKSTPIWRADQLLANLNLLIERARAAGTAIAYVQHSSEKVLPYGSDAWRLHPALAVPAPGDLLIEKEHGNAFEKTDLERQLDENSVGRLIIAGLVTHGCVRATCEGALALGYDVVLVADGHSSYSKDAAALVEQWNEKLAAAGARVLKSAELTLAPLAATNT